MSNYHNTVHGVGGMTMKVTTEIYLLRVRVKRGLMNLDEIAKVPNVTTSEKI